MKEMTRIVGFPLYDGCTLVDFAGATQVFAFTSDTFKPIWLADRLRPVATTEGVDVMPGYTFDDHPELDLLFVPGGGPAVGERMRDERFIAWLRDTAAQVQARKGWVGSVCSGAFLLATAGLLDGFRATRGCVDADGAPSKGRCGATTYWSLRPVLEMFPAIELAPGYPRWLIDEESRRFTGGGVSSSLDLGLALVEAIAGTAVAQASQLSIQYHPGPPVQLGDPGQADDEEKRRLATEICCGQVPFVEGMADAVRAVLGDSAGPAPSDPCGDNGLGPCTDNS